MKLHLPKHLLTAVLLCFASFTTVAYATTESGDTRTENGSDGNGTYYFVKPGSFPNTFDGDRAVIVNTGNLHEAVQMGDGAYNNVTSLTIESGLVTTTHGGNNGCIGNSSSSNKDSSNITIKGGGVFQVIGGANNPDAFGHKNRTYTNSITLEGSERSSAELKLTPVAAGRSVTMSSNLTMNGNASITGEAGFNTFGCNITATKQDNSIRHIILRENVTISTDNTAKLSVEQFSAYASNDSTQTLTKEGAGTLSIDGESKLIKVTLSAGNLEVNAQTAITSSLTIGTDGTLTVGDGGKLDLTGGTLTNSGKIKLEAGALLDWKQQYDNGDTFTVGSMVNFQGKSSMANLSARQTATYENNAITVSGSIATVKWNGGNEGIWAENSGEVWLNTETNQSDRFYAHDNVQFIGAAETPLRITQQGSQTASAMTLENTSLVVGGDLSVTDLHVGGTVSIERAENANISVSGTLYLQDTSLTVGSALSVTDLRVGGAVSITGKDNAQLAWTNIGETTNGVTSLTLNDMNSFITTGSNYTPAITGTATEKVDITVNGGSLTLTSRGKDADNSNKVFEHVNINVNNATLNLGMAALGYQKHGNTITLQGTDAEHRATLHSSPASDSNTYGFDIVLNGHTRVTAESGTSFNTFADGHMAIQVSDTDNEIEAQLQLRKALSVKFTEENSELTICNLAKNDDGANNGSLTISADRAADTSASGTLTIKALSADFNRTIDVKDYCTLAFNGNVTIVGTMSMTFTQNAVMAVTDGTLTLNKELTLKNTGNLQLAGSGKLVASSNLSHDGVTYSNSATISRSDKNGEQANLSLFNKNYQISGGQVSIAGGDTDGARIVRAAFDGTAVAYTGTGQMSLANTQKMTSLTTSESTATLQIGWKDRQNTQINGEASIGTLSGFSRVSVKAGSSLTLSTATLGSIGADGDGATSGTTKLTGKNGATGTVRSVTIDGTGLAGAGTDLQTLGELVSLDIAFAADSADVQNVTMQDVTLSTSGTVNYANAKAVAATASGTPMALMTYAAESPDTPKTLTAMAVQNGGTTTGTLTVDVTQDLLKANCGKDLKWVFLNQVTLGSDFTVTLGEILTGMVNNGQPKVYLTLGDSEDSGTETLLTSDNIGKITTATGGLLAGTTGPAYVTLTVKNIPEPATATLSLLALAALAARRRRTKATPRHSAESL